MSLSEQDAYHELSAYTLAHRGKTFIHQHVLDVYMAQHATPQSKPIGVAFSLAGLYLKIERGFTGLEVQNAHRQMAREKRPWPVFILPEHRGAITALDVLNAAPGIERDQAIDKWCASVWQAFSMNRAVVIALLRDTRVL